MHALLIMNENAGSIARDKDALTRNRVLETLRGAGIDATVPSTSSPTLPAQLAAAVAARPDAVLVGGGDGTISTAAGSLVDTGIALGVLPLGTLNHFAHDLGLPPDWRDTVEVFARGASRQVDAAEVNGHIFINNCSLGSYAEAVRRRDALRREHGHGKWRAMLLASIAVWRNLRRMRLRIEAPAESVSLRTPFLLVANNRYTGSVLDATLRPRLDEGQLWCYSTRARRAGSLLRLVWQTLTRRIDEADALEVRTATEMTVTSERGRIPVAADGEVISVDPPLRFRIRPAALRVLAPPAPPLA